MNRPVILSDLDDTLFQTRRKMVDGVTAESITVGAVDRRLQPHSFMTAEQAMLVEWLLEHAELIPVTARGTDEISRVQIPFRSWRIITHGAVILDPAGQPDEMWRARMLQNLAPFRQQLLSLQHLIAEQAAARQINVWTRMYIEYDDVPVYLVIKHQDNTRLDELYAFADEIEKLFPSDNFYHHRNGNNVSWLPQPVEKGLATAWLLEKLHAERGTFPVIALGDSLSDHRFMKLCSWYGVPRQSQFADAIAASLFSEIKHA